MEQDSHLDPDALNSGDKTVTVPLTEDTDYAIVPLMAQVEYPADGSRTDVLLPENVTLLDYDGEPAQDTTVLHSEYNAHWDFCHPICNCFTDIFQNCEGNFVGHKRRSPCEKHFYKLTYGGYSTKEQNTLYGGCTAVEFIRQQRHH